MAIPRHPLENNGETSNVNTKPKPMTGKLHGMKREDILKVLAEHRAEITSRFNVASLSVFGSAARDEATSESDVDILVNFVQAPGMFGYLELKQLDF